MSDNGRYISFSTGTAQLASQVYLRDMTAGTTTLVSAAYLSTQPANGISFSSNSSASSDGRYIAFLSNATNLTATATMGTVFYAYVRDTCAGQGPGCNPSTHLVSVDDHGNPMPVAVINPFGWGIAISGDGHRVAFASNGFPLSVVRTGGVQIGIVPTGF